MSLLLATAVIIWDLWSEIIWIKNKLYVWSIQPLRKYYDSSRTCSLLYDVNTVQIKVKISPNNSQVYVSKMQ